MLKNSDSNLPLSLTVWLAHDSYGYTNNPKVISATTLLKPIKSLVLSQLPEAQRETDIASLIPSRMGTAIHEAIEVAWLDRPLEALTALGYPPNMIAKIVINPTLVKPGQIPIYLEQRVNKKFEDYIITGQFDFVENGVLEDFKTTSTYNWISQSNADKYVLQGSIYRWLNPDIITEDYMYIRYIFTDWSSTKAKQDSSYPQSRIISNKYTLKSLGEIEQFIRSRLNQLKQYIGKPQEELPPCTPEELWQKPSVYKYYKNPQKKTRSTANFDTYYEAHQKWLDDQCVGEIVTVPGEVVFCKYCNASGICNQARAYMLEGKLAL